MTTTTEKTSVLRYVITKIDKHGDRVLATAGQGRFTHPTKADAQNMLDAMLANNSQDTLKSVYGDTSKMEVRQCQCYPGHFDPMSYYFDMIDQETELTDIDPDDKCSVTGLRHKPDWSNVTVVVDAVTYIDIACADCGRSGCVGNQSTLSRDIQW